MRTGLCPVARSLRDRTSNLVKDGFDGGQSFSPFTSTNLVAKVHY